MVKVIDKGVIEYAKAWEFQKEIFEAISSGTDKEAGYLVYCEHPHVYTLGKSGQAGNLLVDDAFLKSIDATFYKTDRGGDITYHGYGQIVGYPILNLERYGLSLREYIELLEQAVINCLARFGIEAGRISGATGVWISSGGRERKICAIGVRASRYVTMHGFALNVNTDLNYFNYINPCGFTTKGVTSMREELSVKEVMFESVKEIFTQEFDALFGEKRQ
ncbi:MAG: lipoyl(octanoyl) transferase LipB [Rikenellaceae bacterium]